MSDFLQPIETNYKGYKFRSRLEARWAVFFDALNLRWDYEVEGFKLSDGRYYLPDFRVTSDKSLVYWYEIKPLEDKGDGKLQRFAMDWSAKYPEDRITDFSILSGDPFDLLHNSLNQLKNAESSDRFYETKNCICLRCAGINNLRISNPWYNEISFTCYQCDINTPGGDSPVENGAIVDVRPYKGDIIIEGDEIKSYISKVEDAYNKARSARF